MRLCLSSLMRWQSVWVLLILAGWQPTQANEVELRGIADFQELNKRYYLAAYHDNADKTERQMLIKVKARRLSARKWREHWQNNILINMAESTQEISKDLQAFLDLPEEPLRQEDEVLIEYKKGKNTLVFLNGAELISSSDLGFFNALLATWTGKFSPSRQLREQISGEMPLDMTLVEQLKVPVKPERVAMVAKWQAKKDAVKKAKRREAELAQRAQQEKQREAARQKALEEARILEEARRIAREEAEQKRLKAEQRREAKRKAELAEKAKREQVISGGAAIRSVFMLEAQKDKVAAE